MPQDIQTPSLSDIFNLLSEMRKDMGNRSVHPQAESSEGSSLSDKMSMVDSGLIGQCKSAQDLLSMPSLTHFCVKDEGEHIHIICNTCNRSVFQNI